MTIDTNYVLLKLRRLLTYVLMAVLFIMVFLRSQQNMRSEDTVFHIKNGEYILQNGIPSMDVYTFTVNGQPWEVHEWLWQVFLYWLYSSFGEGSIVWLQTLILMSLVCILFLIGSRKKQLWVVLLFLLAAILVQPKRAFIRPDIVSLEFIVIMLTIMWSKLSKTWSLWVLFLLQVVWVNIHGFFILGPIGAFIILISELIKRKCPLPWGWNKAGRLSDAEFRRLIVIVPALMSACLINPQFIEGAMYSFRVLLSAADETKHLFSYVGELQKPDILINFLNIKRWLAFKVLLIFSILSFVINWRKLDIKLFLLWTLFLAFSLSANRNVIFFAPAAYLAIILNLSSVNLSSFLSFSKTWQYVRYGIVTLILLIAIFYGSLYVRYKFWHREYFNLATQEITSSYGHFSEEGFARKALDFMVSNKITGNFINNLDMGLYMIFRGSPDIKVFFDGRVEIFSKEIYDAYLEIVNEGNWDTFQAQIKKYPITGVFISNLNGAIPQAHFLWKLYSDLNWKLVYFDYDGVIFLKMIPRNERIINEFEINLSSWINIPILEVSKENKIINRALARAYYNRAVILNELGFYEQAKGEIDETLKIQPSEKRYVLLKTEIKHDAQIMQDLLSH